MIFEYLGTDFMIDYFNGDISLYLSFTSHTYFKRVVSFAFSLFLNDVLWLSYLFLKFPSAFPRYILSGLTVVEAMHLYIISLVWQLPSSGQLFLFLRLHWFLGVFISLVTFLLCVLIMLDKFSVQQ